MLKKYRQVGRWVASLGPARIASLCSMKIGLSMTVRYRGHHCTQLRLGVFSPVGRDYRPPTLIRGMVQRTEREGGRKREGGRERERERGREREREGGREREREGERERGREEEREREGGRKREGGRERERERERGREEERERGGGEKLKIVS